MSFIAVLENWIAFDFVNAQNITMNPKIIEWAEAQITVTTREKFMVIVPIDWSQKPLGENYIPTAQDLRIKSLEFFRDEYGEPVWRFKKVNYQ